MIKLFAIDVDGVMTDGTMLYGAEGEVLKAFHAQDGLGLKCLQKSGVEVVVISGRESAPLSRRLKDLGIHRAHLRIKDKRRVLADICDELGLSFADCAFMGDDWVDLEVMQAVALPLAPANAVAEVKKLAHWISPSKGGHGAVREACEHIAALNGTPLIAQFDQTVRQG